MNLMTNERYLQEVASLAESPMDWDKLQDKTILITGATGMIASYLIDALMLRNQRQILCRRDFISTLSRKSCCRAGKEHQHSQ